MVFGYIITAVCNILNERYSWITWRWAFYFQFLILLVNFAILYKIPEEDLSTNGILSTNTDNQKDNFKNYPVLRMSLRMPSFVLNRSIDFDGEEISDIDLETPLSNPLKENLIEKDESLTGIIGTAKIIFYK